MSHARRSHQRSTSAVILTRSDASTGMVPPPPAPPSTRSRLWVTVLIWIVLGSLITALWASLLFGDASPLNG